MNLTIPFGTERKNLAIELPRDDVVVATCANPPAGGTWAEVVDRALREPIGVRPIRSEKLRGKKVAVITDDWGRPTPAGEAFPPILDELAAAGAEDANVTFITGSGMHDPISAADIERKVGSAVFRRFRCISHDAGDRDMLRFVGITRQGTPVWANRLVVEADYVVVLGRIYLHESHGYEGGYKMILPAVSSFDTITRDHAFNFSPLSITGVLDGNPSRDETDEVGKLVGIDFLVNVVVNAKSEPVRAFAGEPLPAHHAGVEFGDRNVWGSEVGEPADFVVTSYGSGNPPARYDLDVIWRAARVATPGGTIVAVTPTGVTYGETVGTAMADDEVMALPPDEFRKKLRDLAFDQVLYLHERRRWPIDERAVQWRIKDVRGEYYRRRRIAEISGRTVICTPDPEAALRDAIAARRGRSTRVIVIPEGKVTLPKERLYCAEPAVVGEMIAAR